MEWGRQRRTGLQAVGKKGEGSHVERLTVCLGKPPWFAIAEDEAVGTGTIGKPLKVPNDAAKSPKAPSHSCRGPGTVARL